VCLTSRARGCAQFLHKENWENWEYRDMGKQWWADWDQWVAGTFRKDALSVFACAFFGCNKKSTAKPACIFHNTGGLAFIPGQFILFL
jgi:hypothetical protein